jgi:Tfp pilus assembly protein PilO
VDTPAKKKPDLKAKLIERMHDPLQLRAVLCVGLLVAWYALGYMPMRDRIALTTSKLERDRKRLALATEVEALRGQAAEFADRVPPRSDPNEFLQYVLAGVRSGPLKLVSLSPEKPKDAGPYQVASVRIDLEGKYKDVDSFLRWVENDKRLLRIDAVKVDPDSKDPDVLKVALTVLGLMGAEESAKAAPKAEATRARPKAVGPKGEPSPKKSAR